MSAAANPTLVENLPPRQLRVFAVITFAAKMGIALTGRELAGHLRRHSGKKAGQPITAAAAGVIVDEFEAATWTTVQGRASVQGRHLIVSREAVAALEEVRLQQHLDRDREDLAADERGLAEVGEWERIAQLLATIGGTYDPASDAVVQDELAAAAEEELRDLELEQERQEQLHSNGLPERAHLLMALEKAGLLGTTGTHYGAEGPLVLHEPEDRHALDYLNEYGEFYEMSLILEGYGMAPPRDLDTVPASVRAHSTLLRAMARAGTLEGFDAGHAVRLAQADPAAVLALAAWIESRNRSSR